jgi:2-dehydropantoate 2-reductase
MKVTILGTGTMACLFGARLADYAEITLLGTWREAIDTIRSEGIRYETPDGVVLARVKATDSPSACADSDLLLVLTKANRTRASAEGAADALKESGLALTLQNGLGNIEILQEVFGAERTAGGTTVLGATLLGPGSVRLNGEGAIRVQKHPRILPALDLLTGAGFETHLSEDIQSLLWGKLVANSAINPLSALLRIPNGELVEREQVRLTLEAVAGETAGIAAALGITLPYDDPAAYVVEVARRTASNRSSMLRDLESGRETEVEAINGAVVAAAGKAGVPSPWNVNMLQMIQAAENSGR